MCDAAIRPFPDDTEVRCERDLPHSQHEGTLRDYAFPGSATAIGWAEDDRRTFHGEWPGQCMTGDIECILPLGHRGDHAW